jgi:hypothetical protein
VYAHRAILETMNTTAAGTVQVGQHVSTIPSIASGRTDRTAGVVTEVETYDIAGHLFVDIHMAAEMVTLTISANAMVQVNA